MSTGGTKEHAPPARPSERRERPALVVAFPRSAAAPLPASEPVGRSWLEKLGTPDDEVSTKHVAIHRRAGSAVDLEDVGSRNGTWVDGAPVAKGEMVRLGDGALIRIGSTLLVYRERFAGSFAPSPAIGGMVGPYGLRRVAAGIASFTEHPPGNVLIVGETGAGKELAAAAVSHALNRGAPVAVNLGAVASGVFESQLFGHVAGAFSDARKASRGLVGGADGGAVFLDEIGELPLELQPKLLRLLENREVQPVGADRPTKVDVLLVAATNRDLEAMVETGTFRRDLLARLQSAVLELPAVRDRAEDVFAIVAALSAAAGVPLAPGEVEVEAMERILLAPHPSNVRGLSALLARLRASDPGGGIKQWAVEQVLGSAAAAPSGRALVPAKVAEVLAACDGNESEAARRLGVSRGALRRFLART
jgi:transcriptional regulator with GAF, ATPase, and Fis domain